jgi:hypothetical protein
MDDYFNEVPTLQENITCSRCPTYGILVAFDKSCKSLLEMFNNVGLHHKLEILGLGVVPPKLLQILADCASPGVASIRAA